MNRYSTCFRELTNTDKFKIIVTGGQRIKNDSALQSQSIKQEAIPLQAGTKPKQNAGKKKNSSQREFDLCWILITVLICCIVSLISHIASPGNFLFKVIDVIFAVVAVVGISKLFHMASNIRASGSQNVQPSVSQCQCTQAAVSTAPRPTVQPSEQNAPAAEDDFKPGTGGMRHGFLIVDVTAKTVHAYSYKQDEQSSEKIEKQPDASGVLKYLIAYRHEKSGKWNVITCGSNNRRYNYTVKDLGTGAFSVLKEGRYDVYGIANDDIPNARDSMEDVLAGLAGDR